MTVSKDLSVPTYDRLMRPLLKALHALGGSGTIDEIYEEVIEQEGYSEELASQMQSPERSNQTKLGYRLAWARTYLKKAGYVDNSSRGVWALTKKGKESTPEEIDPLEVVQFVRALDGKSISSEVPSAEDARRMECQGDSLGDGPPEAQSWREQLHNVLISQMSADAFERLAQRLLRESGFIHVEVTGRTGDGGIDGKGIARINGLMSFHIAFQCKKYRGSVSASEIRDFRGATVGRSDRGLFITTGSFTKSAVEEANRDGAAPIDLIDGDQLADKLKELKLGVRTEWVERTCIDPDWFLSL